MSCELVSVYNEMNVYLTENLSLIGTPVSESAAPESIRGSLFNTADTPG